MSCILPAVISVGHPRGKVNFTTIEELDWKKSGKEKKLYIAINMWNQKTNKVCFSSECHGDFVGGEIDLLPTISSLSGKEKWRICSGKIIFECNWYSTVADVNIKDIYCQFLIKIS